METHPKARDRLLGCSQCIILSSQRRFLHLPITYAEFLDAYVLSIKMVYWQCFPQTHHRKIINCGCRRQSRMRRPNDYELLRLRAITEDHTRVGKEICAECFNVRCTYPVRCVLLQIFVVNLRSVWVHCGNVAASIPFKRKKLLPE